MTTTTTTTAAAEISCNKLTFSTATTDNTPSTATTTTTITTIIRFHPEYEKIVSKLKSEEYQELKSSIAENGLYHPIIINKDGFILDGHHRFKACCELGIITQQEKAKFEVKNFDNSYSEKIFVIDSNLARRQMEPYSRVELVLLKKEEHLKLGKQRMGKAGEKGNVIKWNCIHQRHEQQQQQQCYLDTSSSATTALEEEEEERNNNNKNIVFIEIDKPDNNGSSGSSTSSLPLLSSSFSSSSSSPFNTQKQLAQESQVSPSTFYEAEYITKNATEEQKEKLRYGQIKIHAVYTILKQKERLDEVNAKIESGLMLSDKDILNKLNISIRFSDVWNFRLLHEDERFGQKDYPGRTFAQLIFNTLYFFTEKGDLVVDPMAGGGVVGDVCKVMGRRCHMYDVNPVRKDIAKYDLVKQQGLFLPKEAENADLIFWDPPYYKKKKEEYGPQSISSLPRKEYLEVFEEAAKAFAKKRVKKVALLISNYDNDGRYNNGHLGEEEEEEENNIFIHHYINQFEKTGKWRVCRMIDCPFSSKQISAPIAAHCLKSKKMARLSRYLVIFVRRREHQI
jgi:DNA modification methylase